MSKEVNKFILEGEEIEFTDSKARQDINTLDGKIDDEVDRLETEINGKATIDDSDITTNKTWSSSLIFAEDNATREITATLNLTNRAEVNYNVGDLIVYNSKLYKVIASINQGASLTPGTNIQLSKVSTELKGLENTCGNLQAQINNKATIDDSDITTNKTWSSSKILAEDNSIRENIATFNLTNRAEQNYDVGDLIEWNYKLCKVIAPISQGDLLELGVNINRTTVANELYQGSGSEIDDLVISTQKTWSSSKINNELNGVVSTTLELNIGNSTYQCPLIKKGNTVILNMELTGLTLTAGALSIGTLPPDYRPNVDLALPVLTIKDTNVWNTTEIYSSYISMNNLGSIALLTGNNYSNINRISSSIQWEV